MTRKVCVQLSEQLFEQLKATMEHSSAGKRMVVEAALERYLDPVPSGEDIAHGHLDRISKQLERLEHELRIIGETAALHVRYRLTVPPMPQSQQREACQIDHDRPTVLAGQVDSRFRLGRSLIQETISGLTVPNVAGSLLESQKDTSKSSRTADQETPPIAAEVPNSELTAAVREDGSPIFGTCRTNSAETAGKVEPSAPRAKGDRFDSQMWGIARRLPTWRLIAGVFLPFAAGYYLSYLFRTINTLISGPLVSDLGLDAAELGLLTSVYFLVFAAAQIPVGTLLDRFGPRRVQSGLMSIAAAGAGLFATSTAFVPLLLARALIALGVAASLMAGLKAIIVWFPRERVALVNGYMVMLGSLGAVTATAPADVLLGWIGWRGLFELLAVATGGVAALIYLLVPDSPPAQSQHSHSRALKEIYLNRRFWRIAPLSASCVGSAWALQALWAAPWLTDVEGLDRPSLATHLFVMALGISVGASLLGIVADRLRRRRVQTEVLFAALAVVFVAAELALILRLPFPSLLPWSVVSVVGAASVLSYAIIADYFPTELGARANGGLNLLHFGWAFVVQWSTGLILGQWLPQDGHYPVVAYRMAFGASVGFQVLALAWFIWPSIRRLGRTTTPSFVREPSGDWHESMVPSADTAILEPLEGAEW
ncbi:MFS transporter [Bradyrhizobium sp. ISRA443]|uniref:MFS transporter n=1 Tax=unclassified Bradyrhizobium TaxID=2631580 RepID=UPI0032AFDEC4